MSSCRGERAPSAAKAYESECRFFKKVARTHSWFISGAQTHFICTLYQTMYVASGFFRFLVFVVLISTRGFLLTHDLFICGAPDFVTLKGVSARNE